MCVLPVPYLNFDDFWKILGVRSLSSHSRIFHSYGDVNIAVEGLQIFTYARHSWPLSSEGSLTCHTYCDMGLPFIMLISQDQWHSHLLLSVWQWSCPYLILWHRSVATRDQTPISCMQGKRSTSTPLRRFLNSEQMYTILLWLWFWSCVDLKGIWGSDSDPTLVIFIIWELFGGCGCLSLQPKLFINCLKYFIDINCGH